MIKVLVILIIIIVSILLLLEQYCRWNGKTALELLHPEWFEDPTKFPYDEFPCQKNHFEYKKTLEKGYKKMKDTRIIISGLCMNIEEKIPKLEKRITHLGSYFRNYKCVVFENDSTDNTRQLLKKIPNFIVIDCPEACDCKLKRSGARASGMLSEVRMQRMAEYRDRLVNFIVKNYSDYDCVLFMDLDLEGPISMDGIAHSFGLYDTWDSISAFGITGVALTLGRQIYYDYIAYIDETGSRNMSKSNAIKGVVDIVPSMIELSTKKVGDAPFRVKSAFCGLALYKMELFNNGINYTPKDGIYPCEHHIIHNNMIDSGYDRIYINPNMLLLSGLQGPANSLPLY